MNPLPPREYLNQCFTYQDGTLIFKIRPKEHFDKQRTWAMWNAKFSGKRAGRQMPNIPYRQVMVGKVRFLEHRVIAAMHGLDLTNWIDHIDGDGLNNRVENLRPATLSQNQRNQRGWKGKQTRVGVHKKSNGRYVVLLRVEGRSKSFGTFIREADAVAARVAAEKLHYGEFAVSNSRAAFGAERDVVFGDMEVA